MGVDFFGAQRLLLKRDPVLRNHQLKGKYKGYRSIDVTDDVRALYLQKEHEAIFDAVGTHSQFCMGSVNRLTLGLQVLLDKYSLATMPVGLGTSSPATTLPGKPVSKTARSCPIRIYR